MGNNDSAYKPFLDLSMEQRVNICQNAAAELFDFFKKVGLVEKQSDLVTSFFTTLIGFSIAADWKVTPNETAIFNAVFGTQYNANELAGLLGNIRTNEKNLDALDEFIDAMQQEQKDLCCYIILAIASADGEISEYEENMFARIYR